MLDQRPGPGGARDAAQAPALVAGDASARLTRPSGLAFLVFDQVRPILDVEIVAGHRGIESTVPRQAAQVRCVVAAGTAGQQHESRLDATDARCLDSSVVDSVDYP